MADELPLHPPRYWRCQNKEECGRKWHHTSMGTVIVAPPVMVPRGANGDLFSGPSMIGAAVREEGACPACGAPCEPEPGFVYGDHPPPRFEIKTADNAKWSYTE